MSKIGKNREDYANKFVDVSKDSPLKEMDEISQYSHAAYLAGFDKSTELTQKLCQDYLKRIKALEKYNEELLIDNKRLYEGDR